MKPIGFLTLVVSLFLAACAPVGQRGHQPCPPVHTPPQGSAERTAVLAGVHEALAKQGFSNVVLVVQYLKVHCGWAWVQADPRAASGTAHYETVSGLLREKAGKWTLVEWMPTEEGTDFVKYFHDLKAKYPAAPADIFPK